MKSENIYKTRLTTAQSQLVKLQESRIERLAASTGFPYKLLKVISPDKVEFFIDKYLVVSIQLKKAEARILLVTSDEQLTAVARGLLIQKEIINLIR